jgi:hypothetical protein
MSDRHGRESRNSFQRQLSQIQAGSDRSEFSPYVPSSLQSLYNDLDETPRYTTAATNIFIRALTIPIPNDDTVEPEYREPLYQNITTPDNYMESPSDEHLPRYFVKQYGSDSGTLGFPDIYGVMYAQGWSNPVLRHACLAVASFWAGRKTGKASTYRAAAHINFLLPELQRVIRSKSFDDGHILAVHMLMSFALDTNRFGVMQKHGEGLVLMLRHLGYLRPTTNGRHCISDNTPPLVIHVWRLALRDEIMCGFGGQKYYNMILPAMEMEAQPYERCMNYFLDQHRLHLKSIKRELFLKDLLTHRILHFQNQVSSLRATQSYKNNMETFEQHIQRQGKGVLRDIIVQRQKISQLYLRAGSKRIIQRFFNHPPFYTSVWDSYCLFIYNSQTYIYATLIIDPKLGKSDKFPERTTAAVDLCRAAAAREKHLSPQAASLCFAGLAFIGDYPRGTVFPPFFRNVVDRVIELAWVESQLETLVRQGRPCPGLHLDILQYLKDHPTVPWQTVWLEVMSSAVA